MGDMWHVKSQVMDTEISDTGPGFDKVWVVTYMVDSGPAKGTTGKVNIPIAEFNATTVKLAIDAAVYHLDQIAAL
jgi:hypothetical protein